MVDNLQPMSPPFRGGNNAEIGENVIYFAKKFGDCEIIPIFALRLGTFPAQGLMGEWLNQRSAKPSTAVRIRFRPPKTSLQVFVERFLIFYA